MKLVMMLATLELLMMLVLVMKLALLLMTPAGSDAGVDECVEDGDGVVVLLV